MNLKTYKYNIFGLNNKQIIDWGGGGGEESQVPVEQ